MLSAVRHVLARSAGGRRRHCSPLFVVLVALAAAAPSASAALPNLTDQVKVPAQLPQLPVKDGAVDDAVNEPLPAPVEDVVQNSPVAPVATRCAGS